MTQEAIERLKAALALSAEHKLSRATVRVEDLRAVLQAKGREVSREGLEKAVSGAFADLGLRAGGMNLTVALEEYYPRIADRIFARLAPAGKEAGW